MIALLAAAVILLVAFVLLERRVRAPMLDLSLLRKPTFTGGLIAAFGISASLFSLLTFLVIYLQNVLGYSAVATGVRFLALTGAIFLTAGIAGRLSTRVPTRLLIGPGFVLIGGGLLLMRGLTTRPALIRQRDFVQDEIASPVAEGAPSDVVALEGVR